MPPSTQCTHTDQIQQVTRGSKGCRDCIKTGETWMYLRICLSCGHVGCCDSSQGKHARKHAFDANHPLIASLEPGESWRYCYIDDVYVHDPVTPPTRGTDWSSWPPQRPQ